MNRERSRASRLVVVWLAVISLAAGACSSADDGVGGASSDESDNEQDLVHEGPGIDVTVPSGALTNELQVAIEVDEAGLTLNGSEDLGLTFSLSANGEQPAAPVEVRIDAEMIEASNPDQVFGARWDAEELVWIPLVTSFDATADHYLLSVDRFSLFGIGEWQIWSNAANDIEWTADQVSAAYMWVTEGVSSSLDRVGDFLTEPGASTIDWLGLAGVERPQCNGSIPEGVVLESPDAGDEAAVHACYETGPDDRVTIHLANNRPYGMVMTKPEGVTVNLERWPQVDLNGEAAMYALYEDISFLDQIYLPPSATARLTIDMAGRERVTLIATSTPAYTGVDTAVGWLAVLYLGDESADSLNAASCVLGGGNSLQAVLDDDSSANPSEFLDEVKSCLEAKGLDLTETLLGDLFDITEATANTVAPMASNGNEIDWSKGAVQETIGLLGERPDPAEILSCFSPCTITGTTELTHPSWGPITVVTYGPDGEGGRLPGGVAAIDDRGQLVWQRQIGEDAGVTHIALAGDRRPAYPDTPGGVTEPTDGAGHIFVDYNPGRFNGVVVLAPTESGFDDFDSLTPDDGYLGRFYYAETTDVDADGIYEIQAYVQNCQPSCAQGLDYSETWAWDGTQYVVVASTAPEPVASPIAHCSQDDRLALAACISTALSDAAFDQDLATAMAIAPSFTATDLSWFEGIRHDIASLPCFDDDLPSSVGCIIDYGGIAQWCTSVDITTRVVWKQSYCGG